jgi:phosphoglycolate phosphatase
MPRSGDIVGPPVAFPIEAIAFDLDGTLLDTIHDLAAAVNVLLDELGLAQLAKDAVREMVGKGMRRLVQRAVTASRGTVPAEGELDVLLVRYQAHYTAVLGRETRVYPDVVESLTALREQGYRLAVVTNKASRFVRPHLARAGIEHLFDIVVGGDDAREKKPSAAPLLLVAERFGLRPADILMVGDSGNDVAAARAAGCPVLVVPYGYREGLPVRSLAADGIVDTLAGVARCVRRASAPSPAR